MANLEPNDVLKTFKDSADDLSYLMMLVDTSTLNQDADFEDYKINNPVAEAAKQTPDDKKPNVEHIHIQNPINDAHTTIEDNLNNNTKLKAIYTLSKDRNNIPSFGHYNHNNKSIIFDQYAHYYLPLDPKLSGQYIPLHKVLHILGFDITSQILAYVRLLKAPMECYKHNVCSLNYCPDNKVYIDRFNIKCPVIIYSNQNQTQEQIETDEKVNAINKFNNKDFVTPDKAIDKIGVHVATTTLHESNSYKSNNKLDLLTHLDCNCHAHNNCPDNIKEVYKNLNNNSLANISIHDTLDKYYNYKKTYKSKKPSPSLSDNDRATFFIVDDKGNKVYIKIHAFFNSDHTINYINFTFTKIASDIFEHTPHMVADSASFECIFNGSTKFGRHYYNILGYKNNDKRIPNKLNTWIETIVHPDDRASFKVKNKLIASKGQNNTLEILYRSRCRDGSYIWTKGLCHVIARKKNGTASRAIGINTNINSVLEGYEILQNRVFTDILTGLKNRTYLVTHLDDFILQSKQVMSLIFADITALKIYNDYLGHTTGDKLLCSATVIIQDNIDIPCELIRLSGDEILCILPNCNKEQAIEVEYKLNCAMLAYNRDAPIRMPVFFGTGHATINLSQFDTSKPLSGKDQVLAHELVYQAIQLADERMQEKKVKDKNKHYLLVKSYVENTLKTTISLYDERLEQ